MRESIAKQNQQPERYEYICEKILETLLRSVGERKRWINGKTRRITFIQL
jgi:hypothetical protein